MQSETSSALHGLLMLVPSDKPVEGRIRLQKEAYLLALKGYEHFQSKRFTFYYYGPYSRQISDALHFGIASDLVEEMAESFGDKRRYSYRLTKEGRSWLEAETSEPDRVVTKYLPVLRSAHWRSLELAASAVYFERAGDAKTREDAFAKALSLKPDCKPYRAEADEVLGKLSL